MENEEIEIFKVYADTRNYRNDGKLYRGALWEISNLGNVRRNGEKYLPFEDKDKYLRFGSRYKLHRAVAELFIPNPENKPTVDHKNRQKFDNRASNLRWATRKEQAENMDWENIRMKLSESLKGIKRSEETKAKMSASKIGKVRAFNPSSAHSVLIDPSQLPEYLSKGYIRGMKIKK